MHLPQKYMAGDLKVEGGPAQTSWWVCKTGFEPECQIKTRIKNNLITTEFKNQRNQKDIFIIA